VALSVLAFGIGRDQFFIPLNGDTPIAIDIAATEPQVELLPVVTVCYRSILDFTGTQFMP